MSADGTLVDTPFILSKEEYDSKVLFDAQLLQSIALDSRSKDIFDKLKLDLSYGIRVDAADASADATTTTTGTNATTTGTTTIGLKFGDLLTHVTLAERAKWKSFYRGMDTSSSTPNSIHDNHLDRLLFCDFRNVRESNKAVEFWQARQTRFFVHNLLQELSDEETDKAKTKI